MGKRDSCRNSTTGFSENVVVEGTSYQMLEVLSFRFRERVPWVPETFLARFPVSVKSFLAASAYGRRCVGLRPTPKISSAREKNLWYPG